MPNAWIQLSSDFVTKKYRIFFILYFYCEQKSKLSLIICIKDLQQSRSINKYNGINFIKELINRQSIE